MQIVYPFMSKNIFHVIYTKAFLKIYKQLFLINETCVRGNRNLIPVSYHWRLSCCRHHLLPIMSLKTSWCSYMIFSAAYRYRKSISIIERVVYIYIYIHVEFLASHCSDLSRCISKFTGWVIIEPSIHRPTSHIFDQLGTENTCKTLLCWFIVMIWVLGYNNM